MLCIVLDAKKSAARFVIQYMNHDHADCSLHGVLRDSAPSRFYLYI